MSSIKFWITLLLQVDIYLQGFLTVIIIWFLTFSETQDLNKMLQRWKKGQY